MNALLALGTHWAWESSLIAAASLVTVLTLAAALRPLFFRERDDIMDRLPGSRPDLPDDGGGSLLHALARPFAWMTRPTRAAELSRLRLRLTQAGLRSAYAMEVFLASKVLLAVIGTVLFIQINAQLSRGLKFPFDLAVAVWVCGLGFIAPNLWLGGRIKKRQLEIERALPEAMDLLVTCVEAGLGLDAALSRVAEEMQLASPLLGGELQLTFLEIQAGVPRRDGFRRLAERTGVEDLRQLSAVLTQTELFGTSIARALRVHADSMRTKRMQRAEEKAAMVGVKMTIPLILCILPSLIAIVLGPAMASIFAKLLTKG
jgi:tight adherence protein C